MAMPSEGWKEFANCKGMPLDDFFEGYEKKVETQLRVDAICGGCMVRMQCLEWALDNDLQGGVFGRKFLNGKNNEKVKQRVLV